MTEVKQTKTKAKAEKKEVFKFESVKKFYFVDEVKAQFRDGKFETDNVEVAEYLRKLEQVKEVK